MSGISGVNELIRKLNRIEARIKCEILEKAVKKGASVIQERAKELVPVDTGELRNSIRTKVETDGDTVKGIIYTNKSYAAYVELGTSKQNPQPYMYPALSERENEAHNVIKDTIKSEIDKIARGG